MRSFLLLLRSALISWAALHIWSSVSYGQDFPLHKRDTLVARLNRALLTLSASHTDELIDIAGAGTIKIRDINGDCVTLNPAGTSSPYPHSLGVHYVAPGLVNLQVLYAPARDMKIPPASHQLPCDLISMMYHNWGKPFVKTLEVYDFWDDLCPHPPSTGTPLSTQRYYMGKTQYLPPNYNYRIDTGVIGKLQDHSYSDKPYDGFAGTFQGKELFRVVRPELEFLAKYEQDGEGNDINIARPVGWELQFRDNDSDPTWDQTLDSAVESIKFITRMERYPGDVCSYSTSMTPDDSAWVGLELKMAVRTGTLPYTYTTHTYTSFCHRAYKGGTIDQNNDALWTAYDNYIVGAVSWWAKFEIDEEGWLCLEVWGGECLYQGSFRIKRIKNPHIPAEACESTYPAGGQFSVDGMTGDIYYSTTTPAMRQLVTCLPLCEKISGSRTMTGVIAASAQSFSDRWPYSSDEYGTKLLKSNDYQNGERGMWRVAESFTYRSDIQTGNGTGVQRNYRNAGVFVNALGQIADAFTLFNWNDRAANDTTKWIRSDSTSRYSPNGDAVESKDPLSVYSAVRLSHQHMLPKLVAKNAHYDDVEFESFEDGVGNTSPVAHSGKYSYRFTTKSYTGLINTLRITSQMLANGLQLQFWVKKSYHGTSSIPVPVAVSGVSGSIDSIAKTGAWTLYRMNASVSGSVDDPITISFKDLLSGVDTVWIDDIRVQPLDAEMICYVYDPITLRLAATFDDQHFGIYNQYNGEGKLVRKMRETERGMKTVAETQYHTPRIAREAEESPRMRGDGRGGMMSANGSREEIASGIVDAPERTGIDNTFDMLSIDGDITDPQVSILGNRPRTMTDLDSLRSAVEDVHLPRLSDITIPEIGTLQEIDLEGIDIPAIPVEDRLVLIAEMKTMDSTLRQLGADRLAAKTDEEKKKLNERIESLLKQRSDLIREKLGLSEEQVRDLIEERREPEN